MKSYFIFMAIPILLLTSCVAFSQEGNEKPLTKLPIIVVTGEDRSYLQIIRLPQIYYMPYRGEKKKGEIPIFYELELAPLVKFKTKITTFPKPELKTFVTPEKVKKISTSPSILPSLSQDYVGIERFSFPQVEKKEKLPVLEKVGKKVLIHPPIQISLSAKEIYYSPPVRPSEKTILAELSPELTPLLDQSKIAPKLFQETSLRQHYAKASLKFPEKEKTPLSIKSSQITQKEKQLIQPPLSAPSMDKVYFPQRVSKSENPFLLASVGIDGSNGFNYQLDYGKETKNHRYLLTLGRESSPQYVTYQDTGEILSKGMDFIQGNIGWGEPGINEAQIFIEGKQKSLSLPESYGKKTKDTYIHLSGQARIFKKWKIMVWGEKSTKEEEESAPEKRYDGFAYGINLTMQPERFPFSIEGGINWDNSAQKSPVENSKNRYQALLQLKPLPPFTFSENLFLESTRIGVKGIKDEQAQLVGFSRLQWYGKKGWKVSLSINKKFYLPRFADTYIPQDYSAVNLNLKPVDMTVFTLETNYSKSPLVDVSLKIFIEHGNDTIWVYNEASAYLSPQTVTVSGNGLTITGNWNITPSVIFEPAYTYKNIKNEQNPGQVVPHQPLNSLKLLLRMHLLKTEISTLTFEAEGEWLSGRYYTFSSSDTIPSSSRAGLKLIYQRRNWKVFVRMESNNYFLSHDYKFDEGKLSFGLEGKLF